MSASDYDYVPVKSKVPPQDRRSADWRLMRRTRAQLARYVGGRPTAIQSTLIEQIAWLDLFILRLQERALISGGAHTAADTSAYLAYSAIRMCALSRLGINQASDPDDWHDPVGEVVAA